MNTSASLPDKIGRYQILERVGRGGMGVLYRGHDPVLDREVAVKVMLADFSDDSEQMRPRFYREAKAAAKLQHRNIVTVFEFAEENNQPHIVMEFLRGVPLSARMEQTPPLTLDDKLDIVAQLCSGLGYAHAQGVVHRDVKPANVFLLQDGTVKLLDFGIAKLSTSTLTRQGDVLGSAPYMSPEQVSGTQDLDGRSDVWSTGVLLYELLTNRKPFQGDGLTTVIVGILKEAPPPVENYAPGLPKQLIDVVARALEKDRDKRFQTAEELGRELQLIRKTHQLSSLPPMEATRFASTNVLKALHDDRQKEDRGLARDRTLQPGVASPSADAPKGLKTWMIGAAAAVALLAAIAGWLLTRPDTAPQNTQAAVPAPATPAEAASGREGGTTAAPPAATTPGPETKKPDPVAEKKTTPVKKAVAPPVDPAPPAPRAGNVVVALSAPYPFEVRDGSRVISPAASSHELSSQTNGRTLRLVAADFMLDHPVKIDGGDDNRFEYSPPGLGRINIRAARGDCKAMIGKRDLGFGPWQPLQVVAGDYRVELVCPDGLNPFQQITVVQGRTAEVRIQQK
ncbi:MAG TPA: serine/threonine-protein kinase [Vicinamibacterales bacterium]|nr:serine/threonine-protein kinase [Vicinamibacterales bacterium]